MNPHDVTSPTEEEMELERLREENGRLRMALEFIRDALEEVEIQHEVGHALSLSRAALSQTKGGEET